MGLGNAWLPSRRSTAHHSGVSVIVLAGHSRLGFSTTGGREKAICDIFEVMNIFLSLVCYVIKSKNLPPKVLATAQRSGDSRYARLSRRRGKPFSVERCTRSFEVTRMEEYPWGFINSISAHLRC